MNLETDEPLAPQRGVLDRWLASLRRLPAVELVWLTGSLAADDAAPGADIDMRFAIADAECERLWKGDKVPLLEGLGEFLILLDRGFLILQTAEGIAIDLWADRASDAARIRAYEWKVCSTACRPASRSSKNCRRAAPPRPGRRQRPRPRRCASRRVWSSSG